MQAQSIIEKWERIAWEAAQAELENGTASPWVSMFVRFGKREVQLEIPRRSLVEARRDIIGAGGAYLASFA